MLKAGGALLGGIAAGTTTVVAESSERFVVDMKNVPDSKLESSDVEVVHDLDAVNVAVVRGREKDVKEITTDYQPDVTYGLNLPDGDWPAAAEEDASDEPFYGYQWDKQAQDIPDAHEVSRGEGTRVAVIDSGIDEGHPDLKPVLNTDLSRSFVGGDITDTGFHGTHVSGIVAADDRNDAGIVGSAPGTDLVTCKVFINPNEALISATLAAIVYSVGIGADVANLSLGGTAARPAVGQFYGRILSRITTYANSHGTLLVSSVGNGAADLQHDAQRIMLPTEAPNVMSISATGPLGFMWDADGEEDEPELEEPPWTPAEYTNYGTNVIDVSAPGGRLNGPPVFPGPATDMVLSTIPRAFGGYGWILGTSMAAPQVSGAAALVKSVNPGYNPNQIRRTLERTADDKGESGADPYHGKGFVQPDDAVRD